jgi:hypothetical protein
MVVTMASQPNSHPSPPSSSPGRDILEMTGILCPHEHFTLLNCPRCKRVTFRGWQCDICPAPSHPTAFTTTDESFFFHPLFIAMYFQHPEPDTQRPCVPNLFSCFTQRTWEHIMNLGRGSEIASLNPVEPEDQYHT